MTLLHKTLRKLLPWHYSFSIHQLLLTISVPFVCCRYLGCELSEAEPVTLYAHVASHPVTSVRKAICSKIQHHSQFEIQNFLSNVSVLHPFPSNATYCSKQAQRPPETCHILYHRSWCFSKRTCKNQKARLHLQFNSAKRLVRVIFWCRL